jgi:hypothetical protein
MSTSLSLAAVRALIPVSDEDLIPPPSLFLHQSTLHGQTHVGRVMVHALRLVAATGFVDEAPCLWAAVYLHDVARLHDGRSPSHGADAWTRLAQLPAMRALFAEGGVRDADYTAIEYAVTVHSCGEPDSSVPHCRLGALLKDADGLDRVRLSDLKVRMLRHEQARAMVPFAQRLYDETASTLRSGPGYFARLWVETLRILAESPTC